MAAQFCLRFEDWVGFRVRQFPVVFDDALGSIPNLNLRPLHREAWRKTGNSKLFPAEIGGWRIPTCNNGDALV